VFLTILLEFQIFQSRYIETDPEDIITLYNSTVSALLLWPVVCCLGFKFASIHDLAYVCLASVIVFTMIKARGEAYQRARVCTLQTVGSSDILFAYACDVIVFRKRPTASSIIGGIIVILAMAIGACMRYRPGMDCRKKQNDCSEEKLLGGQ